MCELSFRCLQQLLFYRTVCVLIVPSVSCMNFISIFLFYICYAHIDIGSNYPLKLCSYIHWIMLNLVTDLIPGIFFPRSESYNLHEKLGILQVPTLKRIWKTPHTLILDHVFQPYFWCCWKRNVYSFLVQF